jgi:hypothetical protein
MMTLMQFEISVQNKPGEIARIAELLGRNSVNIQGISTELNAKKSLIRVITDDEATARRSLKVGGLDFLEKEVLEVSLPDRPGELAKLAKTLARAGINIESLFILSTGTSVERVALGVNDMERAKEALWKYLV